MIGKMLIFGNGLFGAALHRYFANSVCIRMDHLQTKEVERKVLAENPSVVVNCVGKTGRPNVDACETEPEATLFANTTIPLALAEICHRHGIFFVHMSSGCLYSGSNQGKGYGESDPVNFVSNIYLFSKKLTEDALAYSKALVWRVRMPMASYPHPRNLITKLVGYRRVHRVANSATILEDFLPAAKFLLEKRATGIFHMVNEGPEYHDEVLQAYRREVDPTFRFEVIDEGDVQRNVKTARSDCILRTDRLREQGYIMPTIAESLPKLLSHYREQCNQVNS